MVNLGKYLKKLLGIPKFTIIISFFTLLDAIIAVILQCQNEILTIKK